MSKSNKAILTKTSISSKEDLNISNVFEETISITQDSFIDNNKKSNDDSDEDEETDEDEFECEECGTIQGINNCELCDAENICEECYGQGGDYGPNEIWVCNDCLPVCNECGTKLYAAFDECCGKGRSDFPDKEDDSDDE